MKPKVRRRYSAEFKTQAIELLETGRSATELAEELGISANLLYSWKHASKRAQLQSGEVRADDGQDPAGELRALRAELARLKVENDILKKAAVILGTKPPSNSAP